MVILDCPDPIRRGEDGKATRIAVPKLQLDVAFDRPAIVVAGLALRTDRMDLKSNWL